MPSLSIVVPAYNESRRLPATLARIAEYARDAPFGPVELILVDDGSTDGSGEAAEAGAAGLEAAGVTLRTIRNEGNRGKGFSVRRGMLASQSDWVLFSDADLSTPIEEVEGLLQAAVAGGHGVAIGSRALDRSLIGVRQPQHREALGRLFNLGMRFLTGLPFEDTQCGFKLFSRQAAQGIAERQRIEGFGFDVEQLVLARRLGHTVAEVPVRWNDSAGSSVGMRNGAGAFADICRVWWNSRTGKYS